AQITEKEGSISSAKADVDRITGELENKTQRVNELEVQIEAEKNKPAPVVDIAPGLDPWFKGSLERFRDVLYAEAAAPTVQEKLKVFIEFVNSESRLRGVELPFGPSGEVKGFAQQPSIPPNESSSAQNAKTNETKPERLSIKPPSTDYIVVDPDQYSPGGRPIVHRAYVQEQGEISHSVVAATNVDTTVSAPADKSERTPAPPVQTYKPYRSD